MTTATATMGASGARTGPAPDCGEPAEPGQSWAARHLRVQAVEGVQQVAMRAGTGLALAALYGIGMGVGSGVGGMVAHVLTVEATIGSVVVMAVPALHVLLTLLDAPIDPLQMASRCSHALFRTGLLLAGLAPTLALYSTTSDGAASAVLGVLGLYLAGLVGLLGLVTGLARALRDDEAAGKTRASLSAVLGGFTLFVLVLVGRMSAELIALGGGQ